MKKVIVFGMTGSVGQSAIEVVTKNPDKFKIVGGSYYSQKPENFSGHTLQADDNTTESDVISFIDKCQPDIVLNAVTGFSGLKFTTATLKSKTPLALANKESLVVAGDLVMNLSRENKAPIIPVDSEHSAIFQCLENTEKKELEKIILTCSGGPFFGEKDLSAIDPQKALKHPNWDMGAKITVDSATLANKCLEFFEAMHLFSVQPHQIEIVIHRESIIHSMVEFADSSIIAQLSPPNMQLPIAYALNYPQRSDYKLPKVDFTNLQLNFAKPDKKTFRTLEVLDYCAEHGKNLPIVFNAANEEARNAFIEGKISFPQIFEVIEKVVNQTKITSADTFEKIVEIDAQARVKAREIF